MKSKKSKQLLASSMIAKHFKEECEKRNLPPLTKEEKKDIKKCMDTLKENNGKNIYEEKTTEQLLDLRQSLLETKAIIDGDIKFGKDTPDSVRLAITNTYLKIVEKVLVDRGVEVK